ncbi:hypothetical protein SAMN05421734_102293 [Pelagirhabdus alkalitolerans]|uniref:YneQ n=1 Tax=Pelagirhabdus alkalitolerans TaxID=1612202 RepID=A0A1G6H6E7_9BACI|nr:hypothetical protein [Pelagirhabdus alkalitolerans]SDB89801.1 hypothetical protein SAMN05421734_102293 [Pelagirhabdus alkalitolerans]
MAFGITKQELKDWKARVAKNELAFLTHYWYDERFPDVSTVTKVGCRDINYLIEWGYQFNLKKEWIDHRSKYPHFDLMGPVQKHVLEQMELDSHIRRFNL